LTLNGLAWKKRRSPRWSTPVQGAFKGRSTPVSITVMTRTRPIISRPQADINFSVPNF
jgi:hypothetical protein